MNSIDGKVSRFFSWWRNGLSSVWHLQNAPRKLLKLTPDAVEVINNATEESILLTLPELQELSKKNKRDEYYLLVENEKVIRAKIPITKRNLSLSTVAEQLLPFTGDELYVAANELLTNIFIVPRVETSADISMFRGLGVSIKGVAFAGDKAFCFSQAEQSQVSSSQKNIKFFIRLVVISFCIVGFSMVIAWQFQSRLQSELNAKIQTLSIVDKFDSHQELLSQFKLVRAREPKQVLSVLNALVEKLPVDAEIDQLILLENELLIDARASSATEVQTAIHESSLFVESEFVTAISVDAVERKERFRLNVSLREPGLQESLQSQP